MALRWLWYSFFTYLSDFGILADVSIFGTGLGAVQTGYFLLINWTKRKVLKEKAIIYSI